MTKRTGVTAGHDMFRDARGRTKKPTDAALAGTAVGRGELMRRAEHGDAAARELLKRHGDEDTGGDDAQ